MSIYKMTEDIYKRLKRMGLKLVCRRCGKPIRPGDVVVTRHSRTKSTKIGKHRIIYHKSCWDGMFYGR